MLLIKATGIVMKAKVLPIETPKAIAPPSFKSQRRMKSGQYAQLLSFSVILINIKLKDTNS